MHTVETEGGGSITFYVRRQTHDLAGLLLVEPQTWVEVACWSPDGKSAAVAMAPAAALHFVQIAGAYRETLRCALGHDVDEERRRWEAPMSLGDALWMAWHVIVHRRAVGSLWGELQALEHDLVIVRGQLAAERAALSTPERT